MPELRSACFEKLISSHVFKKNKKDGLEPRRCEDVKGNVASEKDPKSFGTSEKQGPVFRIIQEEPGFVGIPCK